MSRFPVSKRTPRERAIRRRRIGLGAMTLGWISAQSALLALTAYVLAGPIGVLFSAAAVFWVLLRARSPQNTELLRRMNGVPLAVADAPGLYRTLHLLTERAGLPQLPRLVLLPQAEPNALAVGSDDGAAIGVTRGLLHIMGRRELTGVLAHEMSHLRNDDSSLITIAEVASRMTTTLARMAALMTILTLPLLLVGMVTMPAAALAMILSAPVVSALLALGLSRTREYLADLDAVALTDDPAGLASALDRLERRPRSMWEILLGTKPAYPEVPEMLKSHPATERRIEKLLELEELPASRQIEHDRRDDGEGRGGRGDGRRVRVVVPVRTL